MDHRKSSQWDVFWKICDSEALLNCLKKNIVLFASNQKKKHWIFILNIIMRSTTYKNQESVKRRATRMINRWNIETISQSKEQRLLNLEENGLLIYASNIWGCPMQKIMTFCIPFFFSEYRTKENTFTLNKLD